MSHRASRRPKRSIRVLLAALSALLAVGSLAPLAPRTTTAAQAAAPELTAPADGAVVQGLPLFAWSAPDAPAGSTARLEVAADAELAEVVVLAETTDASYQQIQALDRTLTYWWRVGLIDPDGETTWSASRTFTLSAPPFEEPTPTPTLEPTATDLPTEIPATETPAPTETETAYATPEPTLPATDGPSETVDPAGTPGGTGPATAPPGATRTTSPTPTRVPTKAAQPSARHAQLVIPPSKLTGTLPERSSLPLAGASRSNGSRSSSTVVDRDLATIWTSATTTPREASVTVKLDRSRSIGKISWVWGLRYHGDRVRIEVSRDQVSWTQVATIANAPTGQWQTLEVNVYTKYIRFRFENPNRDKWVGGLAEIEIFAGKRVVDPAQTPSPTGTPSPATTPQPDGIIVNPSFERGETAWHIEPGAGVVDGVALGGSNAMRLMPEGGYAGQWVDLSPDRVYELSGWGKLARPYDVGNIGILFYDRDGVRLRSLEPRMVPFTTTTYERGVLRFAVTPRAARVVVTVYKLLGGARFYVDDLAIRRVSGTVAPDRPLVTCQQLMLPGYFDPATGLWDQATSSGFGIDIAVFNPESGPDDHFQPAYADKIAKARTAGQRPFGYVYTAYGARPIADVLRDIDTFAEWYGITDIFLDNGATTFELVPYFRTVMGHIHAGGGIAVVNYGWWPHPAYMEFTDIANIFEDSAAVYEHGYERPSWILTYPASKFSHIVYATPLDRMDEVVALSRERNAAYVWISDDNGETLYKNLPTYWSAINRAVREGC